MADILNLSTGERVTEIKPSDTIYCRSGCKNILVDGKMRTLTCRECGAIVDAFQWAVKMAMEESHLLQRIRQLKTEADTHEKRLDEMKAEEQRVKARVRAAKDSLLKTAGI